MEAEQNVRAQDVPDWHWGHLALFLAVVATWLALAGLNLWMGELNQDEGWYLYAAKQMGEGLWPYRDFAFTQAPMLPLVYSWVYGWVGKYGLLGGRAVTWGFGTLGTLFAVWLAMRAGPRRALRFTGGLCFILIAVNVYQSYFTTVVKTYSLASLFLSAGLLALAYVGPRRGFRAATLAGFLLACATATRISLGAALAVGGLYLFICRRRLRLWAWLDFALGGLLGLAVTFLPFMMLGREGFQFGVLEYHTLRESGPWLTQLAYKAGCLSRLGQAYFPAAAAGLALLMLAGRYVVLRGKSPCDRGEGSPLYTGPEDIAPCFNTFLWVTVFALALVHLAAPFPYDDYQVPIYPVYCAALTATAARWWLREEGRRFGETPPWRGLRRLAILVVAWLLCSLYAFSSQQTQSWFVAGRDRIWWRLRSQSPLGQLRDTAQWIRDLNKPTGATELLTQDTYLAVETGLDVPHGMEMGPFSYYPDWPREKAEKIGVLNRDMMLELLATQTNAPIAAFSGYSLAIRSPEVEEVTREDQQAFADILAARYEHVESIPGFGQAGTTLELWRLQQAETEWTPPVETPEE
ncbi:MAG TPA: hypothetical protein PLT37_09680 [Kiritimatiellia bacterium]|nr:hypothetical protein [Kiritimatiellia bacterium]HQF21498.1 hypothetical protein [Kiritimatiellia bacterium]HQG75540.1 hypothetical protein [Kiritimatiellia bacterium]